MGADLMRAARRWAPALLVAASVAMTGVSQAQIFGGDDEARRAIIDLRQRVEAQRQSNEAALLRNKESQDALIQRVSEDNAQLRRSLIELQNQIDLLRTEIARLTGASEQRSRELADIQRLQKDLAQGQQQLQQGVEDRIRQLEPTKVTVDGREILVEPAERRAFDAAMASFRNGDFAAAQSGFLGLISRYPKSGYMPSALFWLGNAQYALRDYKEAISNFRIMMSADGDHPRAPEAMLSIANCQIELKDPRAARKTLEDLVKRYPSSEAASAAKDRIARLR
jgi:tol-pal system protein YbgF